MFDNQPEPGEIVSIPFVGILRHYGVVTVRGTIISNSRLGGGVVEQSLDEFRGGKRLRCHGVQSSINPYLVDMRARRGLGQPYDLTGSNCIDFTRHTHRQTPTGQLAVQPLWLLAICSLVEDDKAKPA